MRIYSDNSNTPFDTFAAASACRDRLFEQTGLPHVVEEVDDGFVVSSATRDTPSVSDGSSYDRPAPDIVVRPALRAFWPTVLLIFGSLSVSYYAGWFADLANRYISALPIPLFVLPTYFEWGGLALAILSFVRLWSAMYSQTYTIHSEGIRSKLGIIARDTVDLRYPHIRSILLRQGLTGRLFNVGTLEFTSAGTDGVDLSMESISRPAAVQAEIQRRIDAY